MTTSIRTFAILAAIGATLATAACTSRYRLDLYWIANGERHKTKVERTEFLKDMVIGDPYKAEKLVAGDGHCVVISTGTRGETQTASQIDVLTWDRNIKMDLYVQLPLNRPIGSMPLKDKAFVDMLGRFDRSVDQTVFIAASGNFKVDSITDSRLFATVDGAFANYNGDTIAFAGQIKVKHKY